MPDVKDISEVTASESSTENNKDFYSDIPEPNSEVAPQPEVKEVEQEDEKHIDKKGANSRIRELNEEAKAAKAEAESLKRKIAELTTPSQYQPNWEQLNQPIKQDENGQVDAGEFEKNILAKAAAIAELKLAQQQHISRVNSEAEKVIEEYSVLNPDSDNYDPELSESVSEAALSYVQANPTKSLKKFVDGLMKPYTRSISKQVGGMQEQLTKQVAETALRPSSAPKSEKNIAEMSMKEMEEKLGIVY